MLHFDKNVGTWIIYLSKGEMIVRIDENTVLFDQSSHWYQPDFFSNVSVRWYRT